MALVLLVGLHGIGMGAFHPTSYGINIGRVPKEWRGLASAVGNSGAGRDGARVGFFRPALLVVGQLPAAFPVLAVPTLVALVLFWHGLPEVKGNAPGGAGEGGRGFSFGQNLRDRDLWARRKS